MSLLHKRIYSDFHLFPKKDIQYKLLNKLVSAWSTFLYLYVYTDKIIINRTGVAGAVLQTTASLTDWTSHLTFSSQSSKHHISQAIRARNLKFLHKAHYLSHVINHMSHVTCYLSGVTCHMSYKNIFSSFGIIFLDKLVDLYGGGPVINRAYPV